MGKKLEQKEVDELLKCKNISTKELFTNTRTSIKCNCLICSHEWNTNIKTLRKGHGCPNCAGNAKHTIDYVLELLKSKNMSLESNYKNTYTDIDIRCLKCNYKFTAKLSTLHGCANCAGIAKFKNEYVQSFLASKNISTTDNYVNIKHKLNCICNICNHTWKTTFKTLHYGDSSCPNCISKKYSQEYVDNFLKSRNISTNQLHINVNNIVDYNCLICNYNWKSTFSSIHNNKTGCPKCAGTLKYSDSYVNEYLLSRNMQKNNLYINNKSLLNLTCLICNYKWKTTFNSVNNALSGCPYCKSAKSEKIVRYAFNKLTNNIFIKAKPKWLLNEKTNHYLELDGYCESMNLAWEHQGRQHYVVVKGFNNCLQKQQERDKIKVEKCKENNVNLIIVPELFAMLKLKNLKQFIKEQLLYNNYQLIDNFDSVKLDWAEALL